MKGESEKIICGTGSISYYYQLQMPQESTYLTVLELCGPSRDSGEFELPGLEMATLFP